MQKMFHQYFLDLSLRKAICDSNINDAHVCIKLGANIHAIKAGVSMLERAIRLLERNPNRKKLNIIKLLLEYGCNPNIIIPYRDPRYFQRVNPLFLILDWVDQQIDKEGKNMDDPSEHLFLLMDCLLLFVQHGLNVSKTDFGRLCFVWFYSSNKRRTIYEVVLVFLSCFGNDNSLFQLGTNYSIKLILLYCFEQKQVQSLL